MLKRATWVFSHRSTYSTASTSSRTTSAEPVDAIYDAIASDPRVDPKRIGLWAFSNGGWTAPVVATQRPIAFMLLVGAPASTLQANIEYEVAKRVQRAGFNDAQIAQAVKMATAILAALDGTGSWETAQALYTASTRQCKKDCGEQPFSTRSRALRRARSRGRRHERCTATQSRFQTRRHDRSHRQDLSGRRTLALSLAHRLSRRYETYVAVGAGLLDGHDRLAPRPQFPEAGKLALLSLPTDRSGHETIRHTFPL